MFHVILFEPEIPPNTGNIIRLCANTGSKLHLIEPLGFALDDKNLKRAGLDYRALTQVTLYPDLTSCLNQFLTDRVFALSSKGKTLYTQGCFQKEDVFIFGPESRGLPPHLLNTFPAKNCLRLPQVTHERSLNLANTAAIMIYEAWRQIQFSCQMEC